MTTVSGHLSRPELDEGPGAGRELILPRMSGRPPRPSPSRPTPTQVSRVNGPMVRVLTTCDVRAACLAVTLVPHRRHLVRISTGLDDAAVTTIISQAVNRLP